jgi:hypothetical protein
MDDESKGAATDNSFSEQLQEPEEEQDEKLSAATAPSTSIPFKNNGCFAFFFSSLLLPTYLASSDTHESITPSNMRPVTLSATSSALMSTSALSAQPTGPALPIDSLPWITVRSDGLITSSRLSKTFAFNEPFTCLSLVADLNALSPSLRMLDSLFSD